MTLEPQDYFASDTDVRVVRVAGAPRLGSGADTRMARFADAMMLPASRKSAKARRIAIGAMLWAGLPLPIRGCGSPEMLDVTDDIMSQAGAVSRLTVLVGTPGPASKATLVLVGSDGSPVAYAKLADTPLARRLVQNEAHVLRCIEEGIGPALLGETASESFSAITVSPLRGEALGLTAPVPMWLLVRGDVSSRRAHLDEHPFVEDLRGFQRDSTSVAVTAMGSSEYAVAPTHGDAAPWNAVHCTDGVSRLFDWEYGVVEGLPETDAAHWGMQIGHVAMRLNPREAVKRTVSELTGSGRIAVSSAVGLCLLTALTLWRRHAEEGNPETAEWWRTCVSECEGLA